MDKKLVERELLRQLQLIGFDRSKTLMEQIVKQLPSDRLGNPPTNNLKIIPPKIPFPEKQPEKFDWQKFEERCKSGDKTLSCPGTIAYNIIKKEIYGTGIWGSGLGTDGAEIVRALKLLRNKHDYNVLLHFIRKYDFEAKAGNFNVMKWIQTNEYSKAYESSRAKIDKTPSALTSDVFWIERWLSEFFNDDELIQIESILKKFNKNERFDAEMVTLTDGTELQKFFQVGFPPAIRQVLHVALPILGLGIGLASGGSATGFIVGGLIEVADATMYYADEDYVSALVALTCAFLPWARILKFAPNLIKSTIKIPKTALKPFIREICDKLAKDGSGQTLSGIEKEVVEGILSKEVQKELQYVVIKQAIKVIIKRATLGKMAWIIYKLVRFGVIAVDFLKWPILVVAGTQLAWETILRMYGIIKDDTQLPKTPPISPYIPDDENLAKILKLVFEKLVSDGKQYSVKNGTSFNLEVLLIQLFLKNSKSWSEMKSLIEIKNRKISITDNSIISKVQLFSTTGTLLGTLNCKGIKSKSVPFNWPYGELPPKQPMIIKVTDINGKTELIKTFYNADIYGGKITTGLSIKWGYYDNATQKMVAAFQSQKGLTNDGIVGAGTLEKMSNLINDNLYIPNNSGVKIKFEDVMKYSISQQEIDKKIQEIGIKTKDVEIEYEKVDKTKIQDSLNNYLDDSSFGEGGEKAINFLQDTISTIYK